MSLSTTSNQDDIDNNIYEIFTNSLVEEFIDTVDCDIWYNFYMEDDVYDYIRAEFIENTFNSGYDNILEEYNKSYTLDFKTSIRLLKFIKEELVDNYESEENFCNMFNDRVDSETKIINQYAYWYIMQNWCDNNLIIKIFKNIYKYNSRKNKHNKLINLYTKLDIKNKQKKTIIKILNDKFDTDILQNIICAY
tara:strand:+ start:554 stop:1132 length:579 start_codon:yes stop_codon:yes gene_type:complete